MVQQIITRKKQHCKKNKKNKKGMNNVNCIQLNDAYRSEKNSMRYSMHINVK